MPSTRPSVSPRFSTDDCTLLDVVLLRNHGFFQAGETRTGILEFPDDAGLISLRIKLTVDVRNEADACMRLQHRLPDAATYTDGYQIGLVLWRAFGGKRPAANHWRAICPVTGRLTRFLYLPPRANRFASRAGHDLRCPSDSFSMAQRPLRTLQRLRREFAELQAAHRPQSRQGGHGLTSKTLEKWQARIAEAEARLNLDLALRLDRATADDAARTQKTRPRNPDRVEQA